MNTAKQIGGALGLAALVAATATPESVAAGSAQRQGLASGYGWAFVLIAVVLAVVALLVLALPSRRDDASAARDAPAKRQHAD